MADNLQDYTLLTIQDVKSRSKFGAGRMIRIVHWVKDGQSVSVLLEKSSYWTDTVTNHVKHAPKGFSLIDLEALRPHWPRIIALLKNPPPIPVGNTED